jgi:hypothetical protein
MAAIGSGPAVRSNPAIITRSTVMAGTAIRAHSAVREESAVWAEATVVTSGTTVAAARVSVAAATAVARRAGVREWRAGIWVVRCWGDEPLAEVRDRRGDRAICNGSTAILESTIRGRPLHRRRAAAPRGSTVG